MDLIFFVQFSNLLEIKTFGLGSRKASPTHLIWSFDCSDWTLRHVHGQVAAE
jgi:hypothetical protein